MRDVSNLEVALVHPRLEYGQIEANRAEILRQVEEAALNGARIILTTEMVVSGYSFESRSEIEPLVETDQGPTITALSALATRLGVYVCLGLAEVDPGTGLYYNSAFILAPDGRRARRRKVSAEPKWACPGPCRQADTMDSPWGRLGVLICSETYYSLLVRTMVLKGVDLLLVPANWTPAGLNPETIWRARALENGINLAVANRAGLDRRMDFDRARSVMINPQGRFIRSGGGADSLIIHTQLPLVEGKLDPSPRLARLANRTPALYHYLCADLRMIKDPTSFFGLPKPGWLQVRALAGDLSKIQTLKDPDFGPGPARLTILPRVSSSDWPLERLTGLARERDGAVFAELVDGSGASLVLVGPEGISSFNPDRLTEPAVADFGPARLGLATLEAALHPELIAAMAKRGCDVVLVSGGRLEEGEQAVLSARATGKIALVGAFENLALISLPHQGPLPWPELLAFPPNSAALDLNTDLIRDRAFQDRLDYLQLLRSE